MSFSIAKAKLPSLVNTFLALLSVILLTLAYPNFDLWFLAWFGLIPLFYAIEREKESAIKSFVLGWIFGVGFFFSTCWWLTYAPITYGGVPSVIAYALLFCVTLLVGLFPAIFSVVFSLVLKHFGTYRILAAPFLWTATEFLRFNLTGNNWNAIGYSQAFSGETLQFASIGGVYLIGFWIVLNNTFFIWLQSFLKKEFDIGISSFYFPYIFFLSKKNRQKAWKIVTSRQQSIIIAMFLLNLFFNIAPSFFTFQKNSSTFFDSDSKNNIIAVQPNVPMSGLKFGEWEKLRERHVALAKNALNNTQKAKDERQATVIIFPESPMNFMYDDDREFQTFIKDFAVKNNAFVLFNSAQPNLKGTNFYNSAVMISPNGEKIGQYDKIHLVPFGEYVPMPEPLAQFVPTMVGNFQYGDKYDLMPFGDAKGGIMICFESHFASLSRQFVLNGADVLIEMTNDGYLGDTPVLRQHLANAVFRAVETNRPVLRVTNVGITAYINERGEVLDATKPYTEDTRSWTIKQSDRSQTFYVKYGDWFAWLCAIISLALLFWCFRKRKKNET